MAHFVIRVGDPNASSMPMSNEYHVLLNGMDISASVARCEVVLDVNELPVVRLDILAESLVLEGELQPEVTATLFAPWRGEGAPEERTLDVAGGGSIRLVYGLPTKQEAQG